MKAVFLVSQFFSETSEQIMCDIIKASSFQYITVVSTVYPALHSLSKYGSVEEEMRAFHELEEDILNWMGNIVCQL